MSCCLHRGLTPTVLRTLNPTMSALLRAPCVLLLGLLLSRVSGSRVRIPPHDQVARVARFVAHQCDWASMATISTHQPVVGRPFSNSFSVSDGPEGSGTGVPYLYLTRMDISVQDLQANPQASLSMTLAQTDYCRQQGFDPQSPLCAHVILTGSVLEVNGTEAEFAKKSLFSRHPEMGAWPKDHGWFFCKFNITQVWVLDYFGGVKLVSPEEYFKASLHTKGEEKRRRRRRRREEEEKKKKKRRRREEAGPDGAPDPGLWAAGPGLSVSSSRGHDHVQPSAVLHPGRVPRPLRTHHHRHVPQGEVLQTQSERSRGGHLQRSGGSELWNLQSAEETQEEHDDGRQRHLHRSDWTSRRRIQRTSCEKRTSEEERAGLPGSERRQQRHLRLPAHAATSSSLTPHFLSASLPVSLIIFQINYFMFIWKC